MWSFKTKKRYRRLIVDEEEETVKAKALSSENSRTKSRKLFYHNLVEVFRKEMRDLIKSMAMRPSHIKAKSSEHLEPLGPDYRGSQKGEGSQVFFRLHDSLLEARVSRSLEVGSRTNEKRNNNKGQDEEWSLPNVTFLSPLKEDEMFGSVVYLKHLTTDQVAIAKVVRKPKGFAFSLNRVQREKKYWTRVGCKNSFYPLLGTFDLGDSEYFVTENVPSISLQALTEGRPGLPEREAALLGAQLVLAVSYLHEQGIVHRSLRPEVITLDWKGLLKIADLSSCQSRGSSTQFTGSNVTFPYIAPEVLRGHPHDIPTDWWNCGAIIYYLLTGEVLFSNYPQEHIFQNISKECVKEALEDILNISALYPESMSLEARNLLNAFLTKSGDKRLKWSREKRLEAIQSQPFFEGIDWTQLASAKSVGRIAMDLDHCFWRSNNIAVHEPLGGDFGQRLGKCLIISHQKSGERGVMKIIWKTRMRSTANGWKKVMEERVVWQRLSGHPYILPLMAFFETEATYNFVAQYVSGACSLSFCMQSAPLPEDVAKVMTGQLALALNYVHEKGVLLRNLSPDSVIVEKSGRLRLAWFESSKITDSSRRQLVDCKYMSPEVVQHQSYGKEADWWAFGVILFQMLTATTPLEVYCNRKALNPHNCPTDVLLRAVEGIPKLLNGSLSTNSRQLLRDFLSPVPGHRLGFKKKTFHQIQVHPFYRGLKWKKLQFPET